MFPAIEAPANQRPPFVNRAAALSEIDARSRRGCLEKKDGFFRVAGYFARAVRVNIVTLLGMKKESLAAPAAFDAAIARYVSCLSGLHPSF